MHAPVTRDKLERFERLLEEGRRRVARKQQSQYGWYDEEGVRQGGLIAFVRYFWKVLEPETPFVDGWPIWAMIEHLEAVTRGEITRLLINIPPGCMKSLLVNVFWPAWEWGPMGLSHYRYVTFSYSASLTERDNGKFRDLVTCEAYRRLYGSGPKGVSLRNKTTLKVHNSRTGWKLASSVGGVGIGERGDRIILDDPHNVKDAESETVRNETTRWFRESLSSRFNNDQTAFVVIMQRVHEADVSGVILEAQLPYTHLMIPMKYEWERQTNEDGAPRETSIGWTDPRWIDPEEVGSIDAAIEECDGALAWPIRFTPTAVEELQHALGPYAYAGQYQQAPAPRGGGIFQRSWWQLWSDKHPNYDYIVASLDGAFTADEENDPSALTIWGTFIDQNRRRRIMLLDAWRKHLKFSGPRVDRLEAPITIDGQLWPADVVTPEMHPTIKKHRNALYRLRCIKEWGLIEHVADSCRRHQVDTLLIEAKASGISAAQELQNRHGLEGWGIQLMPVKGDKVARAYAAVPTFSQLMVYAPDREWAQMVIDEMALFPRHKYDDLTDSATQAINYLRSIGLASSDEEVRALEVDAVTLKEKMPPLYPV
jgi:predicted phage terminase large subunit-like protein